MKRPAATNSRASRQTSRPHLLSIPGADDRYGFDINNKFKPRVGPGIRIWGNKAANVRFEYTCGNTNCSDNQKMVWLSLDLDKLK
ncbi:MAG: hypothetical protein HC846_03975 [Blastocatellia bacterium]|nr:hypothetical protein [Blastocatellia bacterium]